MKIRGDVEIHGGGMRAAFGGSLEQSPVMHKRTDVS
jgi:hypothetical protein